LTCEAARTGAVVIDRADRHVVVLRGPDARRFCNGMFTNNVRSLPVGGANRHCMVDDKARIQGVLDIVCLAEDTFLAVLDGVTAEAFEARYGKYILFDDVELEDLTQGHTVFGLQGPRAHEVLVAAGLSAPSEAGAATVGEGIHVLRSPSTGVDALAVVVPVAQAQAIWGALVTAGALPCGWEAAEILRVEAGVPRWPVDMGERALLHELRLVATCAAFDKGCYIGQEVIHRIDVMGQVTKQLWGLEMGEDALPPSGAEVRVDDQVVGEVRSGAREGMHVRVLAVLRKAAWQPGLAVTVHAGERSVGATVCDLPFPR
jgi:folate-binding protein YgfZ